jgi:ELWxxDGT repeat protein
MRKLLPLLLFVSFPLLAQTPYLVKDINTGGSQTPGSSDPSNFFSFGSSIYFAAASAATGNELWSTDGTLGGSHQVANINTGG